MNKDEVCTCRGFTGNQGEVVTKAQVDGSVVVQLVYRVGNFGSLSKVGRYFVDRLIRYLMSSAQILVLPIRLCIHISFYSKRSIKTLSFFVCVLDILTM